jgi:hypothetical protein
MGVAALASSRARFEDFSGFEKDHPEVAKSDGGELLKLAGPYY